MLRPPSKYNLRFETDLSLYPTLPSCNLWSAKTDWANEVILVPFGVVENLFVVDESRLPLILFLLSSDWLELPRPNWDPMGFIIWCSVLGWDTLLKCVWYCFLPQYLDPLSSISKKYKTYFLKYLLVMQKQNNFMVYQVCITLDIPTMDGGFHRRPSNMNTYWRYRFWLFQLFGRTGYRSRRYV